MTEEQEFNENNVLPDPSTVQLSVDVDVVNATAIRRGKVRELMRMGYTATSIAKILQKGIKMPDDSILDVSCDLSTVKYDIQYVKQEMAASEDGGILEKRAEILDKLYFLYERAMNEYMAAKGQAKNSFLNTALNIMAKITEIEGVKAPEKLEANLSSSMKMSNMADQLNKLGEDERKRIITTIRAILDERREQGVGGVGVSDGAPRIPASTSDDEGVSGES